MVQCNIDNKNVTFRNNCLVLPGLQIEYQSHHKTDQELLLVSGGRAPSERWLKNVASHRMLWCIDHGIDCCYSAGLLPQKLIGDGDSASSLAWSWAESNDVPIARFPVQKDYTDTQLALEMAESAGYFVILTGAMGGRFDHAYSTIFSFGHSHLHGCIADDREAVLFLHQKESINLNFLQSPKAISLLPLTKKTEGVSIDSVLWPLEDAVLHQSLPYAVSNELKNNNACISLKSGILAVYICWYENN